MSGAPPLAVCWRRDGWHILPGEAKLAPMASAPIRLVVLVLCGALLSGRAALGRPSSIDLRWLDRVTYGVNASTLAEYERLGRKRFIEAQLRGDAGALPRPVADQIDELEIQRQDGASLL